MQTLDQQRGGKADDEVDDTGEDQELVGSTDDVAAGAGGVEEVHQAHGVDQRGVLKQDDRLLQQQRGHLAERLGQDDQTHGLAIGHAHRLCGGHLAFGDRLHTGADDFAEVRGFEHHEGHDAGGERPDWRVFTGDPAQYERHRQVEPGDHQQQRDRTEVVHISAGHPRQQFARRQAHQCEDGPQHDAADHAHDHQLQGHDHAVPQARNGGDDAAEIEVHYLPPTEIRPGTATFFSTMRISNIRLMFRVK
ncbi:hypothetical protein D3C85_821760 [compost metagenome]